MSTLNEYIKLRTELNRELTHLEVDNNFLFVANPWKEARLYKEGMVVYYGDPITGGTGGLTWFRANQDNGPSLIFDPSKWDSIGANSISGQIFVKDSNAIINSSTLLEFNSDFIVTYTGQTAKIELNPGSIGYWSPSISDSSTISYTDDVLIGTDIIIDSQYRLSVVGNQLITGYLNVSGLINGINLVNFYNDYSAHGHTLSPVTLTNYNALYPLSNGALSDVNINTVTLATDDILSWDNTTKRWINKVFGVPTHTLGSHSDVADAVSIAPLNNQILRYNSGTLEWENVTIAQDTNFGFSTSPFSHTHDTRYWTKAQLTAVTGAIINYSNIFNTPVAGAPADASYVVIGSNATLTNERVLTGSSSISITDSGVNLPVTLSVVDKTSHQNIEVALDAFNIGIRSKINFITPGSGYITYSITDDSLNDVVNIQIDAVPPVTSVNTFTGDVSLGISNMNDVIIVPALFPGPGVGSPYNALSNILVYDDDISKWVNVQASALLAAVSNIFLDDILDVEIAGSALVDKQILYYDSLSSLWVNGSPNDADIYTSTQLDAGALNSLYYTKIELNSIGGGGQVEWTNLLNIPSLSPASHSHFLYQIVDVDDYSASPPNNGDVLTWNNTLGLWQPAISIGGSGFNQVVSNYNTIGTYTSAIDQTLTISNVNPLRIQSDSGINIETDITNNIIKIGARVDGSTIDFNTAGELTIIGSADDWGIKNFINPIDVIEVLEDYQYFVYGNLTVEGIVNNSGQVVIENGALVLQGAGQFNNIGGGTLTIVDTLSGALSGAGTTNRIPLWSNPSTLADSYLLQDVNGIIIDSGKYLQSSGAISRLDLQNTYFDLNNNSAYTEAWLYGDVSSTQLGFNNVATYYAQAAGLLGNTSLAGLGVTGAGFQFIAGGIIELSVYDNSGTETTRIYSTPLEIMLGQMSHESIILVDNSAGNKTSANTTKYSSFIGSQNSTIASGVINSVIVAGNNLYGKTNNTLYTQQIGYATGSSFETLVSFTAPNANNSIVFQDASGTVAFLSDIIIPPANLSDLDDVLFTTGSPNKNEIIAFNDVSNKWETVEIPISFVVSAGRNSAAATTIYMEQDNVTMNLSPFILPADCELTHITASTNGNETWDAEVHVNGVLVVGATLSVSAAAKGKIKFTTPIQFNEQDEVMLYCNGTSINRPRINAFFRTTMF